MNDELLKLGSDVADALDEHSNPERTISKVRSRLDASLESPAGPFRWMRRSWAMPMLASFAMIVVCVGAWSFLREDSSPLSVVLEQESGPSVGQWVVAGDKTMRLRFSDGTTVSLHPKTHLRVNETTSKGALVELREGQTLARIEPSTNADWRFLAGPFQVRVTGTEFDLAWAPETGVLELTMHHGSVVLTGPGLPPKGRIVEGETVRLTTRPEKSKSSRHESEELATGGPSEPPSSPSSQGEELSKEPEQAPPAQPAPARSWREELSSNDHQAVVQAVKREGRSTVLRSASASELRLLTRAARMGGQPTLARDALLELRNRFNARGESAYLLGKINADQLNETSKAIRWFETYLTESPGGSLAEPALGRLVQLQAGSAAGRRVAKQYLRKYPDGSFAGFARASSR